MSLHANDDFSIPAETVRVARLSLPKGNVYQRMRDELGVWCHDGDFADLFSRRGQPAAAPWRLALVTIMQFAEGLTDRQAPDSALTATIHTHLAQKDLLPGEHLLDAGYVGAGNLTAAQQDHAVTLVGPVARDTSWQAQTQQGFDIACFRIDWEAQTVTCPQGQRSRVWSPGHDAYGNEVIDVRFARADCADCPVRQQCTQAAPRPRHLKLRVRAQHEALQLARQRQTTTAFKAAYAKRAGVEGTIALATEPYGLRRTRYIGLAKTHLQHIFSALALNLARVAAWWAGKPRAQTRVAKFTALRSHFKPPNVLLSLAAAT